MDVKGILISILFIYMSYRFILKFGQKQFDEVLFILTKYPHVECPKGYMLYKIQEQNVIYFIQVQKEFSEKPTQTGNFRRCEQKYLKENVTCDGNVDGTARSSCIVSYPGDGEVFQEACTKIRYKSDVIHDIQDEYESGPSVFGRVLGYFTEVVYGSSSELDDAQEREADLRDYVLLQGIFPGTRWCGFGNIADDVYTNVGEHQQTDSCCRSHDLCEPKIRALQRRYYYNNQGIIPISHCSCDVDFYNCLKGINSPVSNKIGRIFFNVAKIKCFDFVVSDVCTLELMGVCLTRGQKCAAVLKQSPPY
ncbi:uncharacterized protein LOC117333382 [Pecten maximus]|uniref:uncharacterized protein LOC117333382 n=1 Tax=Pecten maximus TaxID=6579 RepID=UPI00145907D1|nr:uncharacterized protein LOC117333382 [Pecten maximus]